MNKVFVDTWAWYALTDVADSSHALAQQTNEQLLDDKYIFVTTNFVLGEAITLIRYNIHHAAAVRFRHMLQSLIEDGLVELVRVDEAQEDAAWSIFEQYADQDFSYTDCTSFAVMHQLGLTHAFTADHHFDDGLYPAALTSPPRLPVNLWHLLDATASDRSPPHQPLLQLRQRLQ